MACHQVMLGCSVAKALLYRRRRQGLEGRTMATILIVDDHPANRAFLRMLLGCKGHRLVEAADGAEGLAIAGAERPDLVITDIRMPTMDGYEFVRRLQAEPACARIPVVFWSAHY